MTQEEREMRRKNQKQGRAAGNYYAAARFTSEPDSARAYRRLHDLLSGSDIGNLSVYRVLINMMPHVIIVGDRPTERGMRRVQEVLSTGEAVTLHDAVVSTLQKRRLQMEP
jgi:hypothetical protein